MSKNNVSAEDGKKNNGQQIRPAAVAAAAWDPARRFFTVHPDDRAEPKAKGANSDEQNVAT